MSLGPLVLCGLKTGWWRAVLVSVAVPSARRAWPAYVDNGNKHINFACCNYCALSSWFILTNHCQPDRRWFKLMHA